MERKFDMLKISRAAIMIDEDDDLIEFVNGKWVCDENAPDEVKEFVEFQNYRIPKNKEANDFIDEAFEEINAKKLMGI